MYVLEHLLLQNSHPLFQVICWHGKLSRTHLGSSFHCVLFPHACIPQPYFPHPLDPSLGASLLLVLHGQSFGLMFNFSVFELEKLDCCISIFQFCH